MRGGALERRQNPTPDFRAVGLAYEWATKIIAMAVVMVGPAWLCERLWGRTPWTFVALAIGVVTGFVYLLWITGALSNSHSNKSGNEPDDGSGDRDT